MRLSHIQNFDLLGDNKEISKCCLGVIYQAALDTYVAHEMLLRTQGVLGPFSEKLFQTPALLWVSLVHTCLFPRWVIQGRGQVKELGPVQVMVCITCPRGWVGVRSQRMRGVCSGQS